MDFYDITGVKLEEGVRIACNTGGRYTAGLSVGLIESIVTEAYDRRVYDYDARAYKKVPDERHILKMKALERNRKSRTFISTDGQFAVVAIADQDFNGDR